MDGMGIGHLCTHDFMTSLIYNGHIATLQQATKHQLLPFLFCDDMKFISSSNHVAVSTEGPEFLVFWGSQY